MELVLKSTDKPGVFQNISDFLQSLNLNVLAKDEQRPWGGFFVMDEEQVQKFCDYFFPGINPSELRIGGGGKLSPKILVVQPEKRLSWQYHHRRSEIWRVIAGNVGVITSDTDQEGPLKKLKSGDTIRLSQGERHRLVGLDEWAVLAEIWQHTDPQKPSDEDDIVRVQDDFGR